MNNKDKCIPQSYKLTITPWQKGKRKHRRKKNVIIILTKTNDTYNTRIVTSNIIITHIYHVLLYITLTMKNLIRREHSINSQ